MMAPLKGKNQSAESRKPTGNVPEAPERKLAAAIDSSPLFLQRKLLHHAEDRPGGLSHRGLPDGLKSGVESLSGMSLDNVTVHYNSAQPAQFNAMAYAQGSDIHLAPGQERHLPHEAWHVVQQAQGRVKPTMQRKGDVPVNDDAGLEHEADAMGAKALSGTALARAALTPAPRPAAPVVQGRLYIGARRNPDAVTPELLATLQNHAENSSAELTAALAGHFADGRDWLVTVAGSITGRHGFAVTGFEEIVRRPAIAGMGNLELAPDASSPLGWSFRGRPGWTAEVVAAVRTQPGLENIRHVIPYHLIRTQFERFLHARFAHHHDQPGGVLLDLQALAAAVGAERFENADAAVAIQGLAMNILARLNSVPGNLWAGSAVENQRLNSLRIRILGLINLLESGALNRQGVLDALRESEVGAGSTIYRELIHGVIQHLPRPGDLNFGNDAVWIERLQLAAQSAEVDVFPSQEELARVANPARMLANVPELMDIFRNFAAGNFWAAAIRLANIPSPHLAAPAPPAPMPPTMLKREDGVVAEAAPADLPGRIQAARRSGAPLDSKVRTDLEIGLGADLSGIRVHHDSASDAMARSVHARAFTTGNDIFFRSSEYNPASTEGKHILAHEAAHTVQQSSGAPFPQGFSLGDPHDAFETEAERFANSFTSRTPKSPLPLFLRGAASAGMIRRMMDGYDPVELREFREAQRRRERERHELWEQSQQQQVAGSLANQSTTLDAERERTRQGLMVKRGDLFQAVEGAKQAALPPDLQERWSAARQLVEPLQLEIDSQDVSPEAQDDFRPVFAGYFQAVLEFASNVEAAQAERQSQENERYLETLHEWQLAHDSMQMDRGDLGGRSAAGSWGLFNPRPQPGYTAPDPVSPYIRASLDLENEATTAEQWQHVISDFDSSTGWMDNFLLYLLPADSAARTGFEYYRDLNIQLDKLAAEHPLAVRIPAMFYPKDDLVPNPDGGSVEIANGIPWQFYLYHTGVESHDRPATAGGEWVLVELTSPQQIKANRADSSDFDAARLQQGDIVNPPIELFEALNSRLRFPKGRLHWIMPTGSPGTLDTTEPWSLSDWLRNIGMTLAAIALIAGIIVTGGLAAPAAVPALTAIGTAAGLAAAGFNIASTVVSLDEKRAHGMLTQEDIDRATLSIAIDIAGALALGLNQIASVASQASRAATLLGRYAFVFRAAAKGATAVALAGDVVQVGTATADFIRAYRAIQNNPKLSDSERDLALVHLVGTGMLTFGLLTVSARGNLHGLRSGGSALNIAGEDPDGTLVIGPPETEPAAARPQAEAEVPLPRPGDTAVAPRTGWSRPLRAAAPGPPQVDTALPSRRVEIRFQRDAEGLVTNIEVVHAPDALPHDIQIHEQVAGIMRRYGGQIGRIPRALDKLQRLFGGDPPPLELQMELRKLEITAAHYQESLARGRLGAPQVAEAEARLALIDREISHVEAAIADPELRAHYESGKVGLPVKPTGVPNLPDVPTGHHYYLSSRSVPPRWELRRNPGFDGPRFDVEYVNGAPTGRSTNANEVGRLTNRVLNNDTRAALNEMGYRIDRNGVIYRPPGHDAAGRPHMEALQLDAQNRIQIATIESLGEQQARIRSGLDATAKAKLEAAEQALKPGEVLRLVEGVHDTGATWAQVLTPQKRAQLHNLLLEDHVPLQDVDRLINGLVNKQGTLKVVLGTTPVRTATNSPADYAAFYGTTPSGEVHHGDPLYLGGGNSPEMLFDLPPGPHDRLHDFFNNLELPASANPAGAPLQPNAIQARVAATARPQAAIIGADKSVRYVPLH